MEVHKEENKSSLSLTSWVRLTSTSWDAPGQLLREYASDIFSRVCVCVCTHNENGFNVVGIAYISKTNFCFHIHLIFLQDAEHDYSIRVCDY